MTAFRPFPLLGEPLALDLVNTRAHLGGVYVDLLDGPRALDRWLRAERCRIAWTGHADADDLAAVIALRGVLDPLLRAHVARAPGPAAAVRGLNRALAIALPQPRLEWTRGGPRKRAASGGARRATLLRQLAGSALELLTGADAARVRRCAHPDCILLFVAGNPRRRWCASSTCGNRARVARHYVRQQQAG